MKNDPKHSAIKAAYEAGTAIQKYNEAQKNYVDVAPGTAMGWWSNHKYRIKPTPKPEIPKTIQVQELVNDDSSEFFIVIAANLLTSQENDDKVYQFSPSTHPHQHPDYQHADEEARKLAKKFPGKEFAVFKSSRIWKYAHKTIPNPALKGVAEVVVPPPAATQNVFTTVMPDMKTTVNPQEQKKGTLKILNSKHGDNIG